MSDSKWVTARLGDLGDFSNGANFKQDDYGAGYPIINVKQLYGGRFVRTDGLESVSAEVISNPTRLFLRDGDLLFARSSVKASGAGQVAMAMHCPPRTIFSGFIIRFRPNSPDRVQPLYLNYLLRSPLYRELLTRIAVGTSIINLSQETLKDLEVTLPPLRVQHVLVSVLGALDDAIELNLRMNETLEAMAKTVFKSWFVDFDPVRAKGDRDQPKGMATEVSSRFPATFCRTSDGDPVPTGWQRGQLEEVLCVLEVGGRPKGGVSSYTSGVPSIGAQSIVGLGKFDFSQVKFIPEDFFRQMGKGHIENRDVLLYKDGGRPGEFEPHVAMFGDGFPFTMAAINEHVYRIRTNPSYSQNLLYFWLSSESCKEEMRRKGTGVAIPGLNSTAVKSLAVLIPPVEVVNAFDEVCEPLVAKVLNNANESHTLAALRDTLLPKLLSGEIQLKHAETMVGAAI